MMQGVHIHYAEDILVMDEKVSSSDNFQRQRLRWMTGQVQAFLQMLPSLPKAVITSNINFIDKTIQQALIPRSILLVLTPILCIIATLTSSICHLKWWLTFALLIIGLYTAIPSQLRTKVVLKKATVLPRLVWRMATNIVFINVKNKDFIHTTHKGNPIRNK